MNSDTKRQGVEQYLAIVDQHGDDVEWSTVSNQRGRENAVAYGPELDRLNHFYLYERDR